MAKESKGQKVKQFTASVPHPDLSITNQVIPVYLDADAMFVVYLPDHITMAIKGHPKRPSELRSDGRIMADTFDPVKNSTTSAFALYQRILREETKVKVILVHFNANRRGDGHNGMMAQNTGFIPSGISFSAPTTLHLRYEVLWRAGGALYRQYGPDSPLEYVASSALGPVKNMQERFEVEWTPEREAFFRKITDGLKELVDRLCLFFGSDLETSINSAITAGGLPALPAPEKEATP